jgi:hypothetical protein
MYLYSLQSIPTVKCQLSIFRTDRTRRSIWPDTSSRWQRSIWKTRALSDRTRRRVWSGVTGRVRSLETSLEPFCTLTELSHSGVRSDRLSVRLLTLALLTVGRTTCASGQASQSVRSVMLLLLLSIVLTGRVWSRQRLRPIKEKWLKLLRIVTQLEPKFFQMIFGLHLSYLVLSLTSVPYT